MKDIRKLAYLFFFLSLLFGIMWYTLGSIDKSIFWQILSILSFGWFVFEAERNWKDKKRIKKSLMIGLLLFIGTFFLDYSGLLNQGYTINRDYSLFAVGADPVELLLIVFFGGSAWFMYLPRKFSLEYSVADILLLAFFGTITEIMLNKFGIMTYLSVDSLNAFVTYGLVWAALHLLNYKVFK